MSVDLKALIERAETWPEAARDELASIAEQIESELQTSEYFASADELNVIDAAMASLDRGEQATDEEIRTAFARFRQ
ncbi:hypothetical protein [Rhodopseudomonas pseudopalustris]|uniref:Uncharacterized protein n=2 Tax=Rhodopseudomonas TaxID=1073 RepID=Q13BB2_RHOPS|nr:hypothetical protein [Rhodopseudomonas pseudopalustris]ABE38627.1 hypothetical protein RPD_1390 [Rhodopseudomonas palustris BisB5]MBB1093034.1 hypothetical protein [Rhodopseudomonas palustris]SEO36800.1 hypothetical protein SAMN05444123_102401 [Rhodopseudomonas pseudopalustris]